MFCSVTKVSRGVSLFVYNIEEGSKYILLIVMMLLPEHPRRLALNLWQKTSMADFAREWLYSSSINCYT